MGSQYTPGLQVSAHSVVKRVRELPLLGKHEVNVGDTVAADDTVLSASLPGEVEIIRVADRLGLEPLDVEGKVLLSPGDSVSKNQLICKVESFFGFFNSELHSPLAGEVEFFTEANAHIGIRRPSIPLTVDAYISGKVVAVEENRRVTIETSGTFIQGIFGVGGERRGTVRVLDTAIDQAVTEADIQKIDSLENSILIGGSFFSEAALTLASKKGVSGIITGSIDAETLKNYVGFEIGVSITGDEEVPATLIVTEGFGKLPISPRVMELAKNCEGMLASLNGATQVRAGAMRPELIVPKENSEQTNCDSGQPTGELLVNSRVRIIRVPYFGLLGTVEELPSKPEAIESGARVRVLRARLDSSGQVVTVPRANVELI